MKKVNLRLRLSFIIAGLCFCLSNFLSAEVSAEKEEAKVPDDIIAQALPAYTLNLRKLIERAQQEIKKIDREIIEEELLGRNRIREAKIREHSAKADILHQQRKLKESRREWEEVLAIAKEMELQEYLRISERKARENEVARKERARWLAQRQRQQESALEELEYKQNLEHARLERYNQIKEYSRLKQKRQQQQRQSQMEKEMKRLLHLGFLRSALSGA